MRKFLNLFCGKSVPFIRANGYESISLSISVMRSIHELACIDRQRFARRFDNKLDQLLSNYRFCKSSWKYFHTFSDYLSDRLFERLLIKYPRLSEDDRKLCCMIVLDLKANEIASVLGIAEESLYIKRKRLRDKLGLEKGISLKQFLSQL